MCDHVYMVLTCARIAGYLVPIKVVAGGQLLVSQGPRKLWVIYEYIYINYIYKYICICNYTDTRLVESSFQIIPVYCWLNPFICICI